LFDTFLLRYLKQVVSKHQFSFLIFFSFVNRKKKKRVDGRRRERKASSALWPFRHRRKTIERLLVWAVGELPACWPFRGSSEPLIRRIPTSA
jgi:hypothetical protein